MCVCRACVTRDETRDEDEMSPTHIRTKEAWASIEHMLELSEHPSTTCASASTRDTRSLFISFGRTLFIPYLVFSLSSLILSSLVVCLSSLIVHLSSSLMIRLSRTHTHALAHRALESSMLLPSLLCSSRLLFSLSSRRISRPSSHLASSLSLSLSLTHLSSHLSSHLISCA